MQTKRNQLQNFTHKEVEKK
jgi:tartrate dehydratase alpha subunit/fumarate hydratase class I-like protein